METFKADTIARARALVTSAEVDLGRINNGQRTDLLLDNMPELNSVPQARRLLQAADIWTPNEEVCQHCGNVVDFGFGKRDETQVHKFKCLACGFSYFRLNAVAVWAAE